MLRRLTSIEGNRQKLDGGAMFGNAPRSLWERWTAPDEANRIDLACRALLVREPARAILFEAGVGAFFEPKLLARYGVEGTQNQLLASLAAEGLCDEDIEVVVLSHLHFDHAGGILADYVAGEPSRLLFPKARFVVGGDAWARAKAPHPRDRASFIAELPLLLEASGRLEIVEVDRCRALGPDYRFHFHYGHTPGLMLAEIPGEAGPIVYVSDTIPGRPWVRRAVTMGYDRFPERLVEEKTALLADLALRGGSVFFTHDPGCALARVALAKEGEATLQEPLAQVRDLVT